MQKDRRIVSIVASAAVLLGLITVGWVVLSGGSGSSPQAAAGPPAGRGGVPTPVEVGPEGTPTLPPLPTLIVPPPTLVMPADARVPFDAKPPELVRPEKSPETGAVARAPEPPQAVPLPTRSAAIAAGRQWATFVDPNLAFSFRYPSDWYVEAQARKDGFDLTRELGVYAVRVLNYDIGTYVKRAPLPSEIQLVVTVRPVGATARSLPEEIGALDLPQGSRIEGLAPRSVGSLNGYEYTITPGERASDSYEFTFRDSAAWYTVAMYPANPEFRWVFDEVVNNFKLK